MTGRSCNQLGMCQSRTPRCPDCTSGQLQHELPTPTYPFAPGVIDGYPKPESPTLTKWLLRWVCFTLGVSLVCLVAGVLP